jgi:hypothetical protein
MALRFSGPTILHAPGATAAGIPGESPLWEELSGKARKIREVLQEDPAFINFIWSAPADADWKDEKVWRDSNPAMGDFLRLASVRAACESAKSSPWEENTCRRLRLNQGCSSRTGSSRRRCGMRRRSGGGVHSVGSYRPARGLELLSDAERETAELVAAFRILPHGSFRRHGSSDGKRRLPAYEIWQVADMESQEQGAERGGGSERESIGRCSGWRYT